MNNKLLQNFLNGFLSCFKFVPTFKSNNRDFEKGWYDNWYRVASYLDNGLKKVERENERK